MAYEVLVERADPRLLAASRGVSWSHADLGPTIIRLLDGVWPMLRRQGVRTGHNVVIYFGGSPLELAAGVEVYDPFEPTETVQPTSTPAGEVARCAHWGEFNDLAGAYAALGDWCAANQRKPTGINWEVYGDWHEDPSQRRTDVCFLLDPAHAAR